MSKAKNERVWGVDWIAYGYGGGRHFRRVSGTGDTRRVEWTNVETRAARMTRAEARAVVGMWGSFCDWRRYLKIVRREPMPKAKAKAAPKRRVR